MNRSISLAIVVLVSVCAVLSALAVAQEAPPEPATTREPAATSRDACEAAIREYQTELDRLHGSMVREIDEVIATLKKSATPATIEKVNAKLQVIEQDRARCESAPTYMPQAAELRNAVKHYAAGATVARDKCRDAVKAIARGLSGRGKNEEATRILNNLAAQCPYLLEPGTFARAAQKPYDKIKDLKGIKLRPVATRLGALIEDSREFRKSAEAIKVEWDQVVAALKDCDKYKDAKLPDHAVVVAAATELAQLFNEPSK